MAMSESFAAIRKNGSVVAWGDSNNCGAVPAQIATLNNIVQVTGNGQLNVSVGSAFAALQKTGRVVTWGSAQTGGGESITASGICALYSADNAFIALTEESGIFTWGNDSYGGDSASVPLLNGKISYEVPTTES